jgi:hypothetical protein
MTMTKENADGWAGAVVGASGMFVLCLLVFNSVGGCHNKELAEEKEYLQDRVNLLDISFGQLQDDYTQLLRTIDEREEIDLNGPSLVRIRVERLLPYGGTLIRTYDGQMLKVSESDLPRDEKMVGEELVVRRNQLPKSYNPFTMEELQAMAEWEELGKKVLPEIVFENNTTFTPGYGWWYEQESESEESIKEKLDKLKAIEDLYKGKEFILEQARKGRMYHTVPGYEGRYYYAPEAEETKEASEAAEAVEAK